MTGHVQTLAVHYTDPTVTHHHMLASYLRLMHVCGVKQLKQLFGFCGSVSSCTFTGSDRQFAMVTYSTKAVSVSQRQNSVCSSSAQQMSGM